MITGKPGEWYQDKYIGGYFDKDGKLVVCEEYGADVQFDNYSVDVQNGDGYYNSEGRYVSYHKD